MDDRANLFMQYKRVLSILKPRAFVFENVVGLLSMNKGRLFEIIQEEFHSLGYILKHKILNAVDYGVPQLRNVYFWWASWKRIVLNIQNLPMGGFEALWTLEDAIGDLPCHKKWGDR